jgi:hypothetical protein
VTSLFLSRDSGYGTLLRNVAASIETSDPDAAQALLRASVTVEELVVECALLRRYVSATKAGRAWLARQVGA